MSETDARMAFERHATSKIREAADLFALYTFGFRGEALPSIAAVAQVELRTRRETDELGTVIHMAASKLESQESDMCPAGTNFQVKNLFFNVPARRKFLKSNQTELNNVMTEMERIALVNPEIAFSLYHNEVELMNVPQSTMRQRIQHLFGKKLGQELLSVEVDTTLVNIKGCVGVPESARKKGANCFFFVNGVCIQNYFRVGVGREFATVLFFKVFAKFSVIVNFTVENDNVSSVLRVYRLMTAFKVNNAQTAEAESDVVINKITVTVGASVNDSIAHLFDDFVSVYKFFVV